jgi:hypothetical protein
MAQKARRRDEEKAEVPAESQWHELEAGSKAGVGGRQGAIVGQAAVEGQPRKKIETETAKVPWPWEGHMPKQSTRTPVSACS